MKSDVFIFKDELEKEFQAIEKSDDLDNCFTFKTMSNFIEDAKLRPIPKMLFSELWFENELCILFSDTNLGKSALAIQIANSISKGLNIEGFKLEVSPQKILYFDFELTDKQLEKRYSNDFKDHYEFNSNFFRAEINQEQDLPEAFKTFEDFLCHSIEQLIIAHSIKIIIIDNLTYLKSDNEKAKEALQLMKLLNNIKRKYKSSILVLAHTPKRDATKPLTKNDVSGSKMLMNFCDSCFAIGESFQDKGLRYIKQIKQRNTEHIYDTHNVIICKIENPSNFLQFTYIGNDSEYEHLKQLPKINNEERLSFILEHKNKGMTNVKIAGLLGCSETTIRNILKEQDI
jgi:predicted transcriptional regulator